jgi:hypothetical protein
MCFSLKKDFIPQDKFEFENFVLERLGHEHVLLDYLAVVSNLEFIIKQRGGKMDDSITLEEDFITLCWKQREFELKKSFSYTMLSIDRKKCVGCVYIYPISYFFNEYAHHYDVDFSFWITQDFYNENRYEEIYNLLLNWLEDNFPFEKNKIRIRNKVNI